jgi:hypothetical protein
MNHTPLSLPPLVSVVVAVGADDAGAVDKLASLYGGLDVLL